MKRTRKRKVSPARRTITRTVTRSVSRKGRSMQSTLKIESWKSAIFAGVALRAASGALDFYANKNPNVLKIPFVQAMLPFALALLSKKRIIPIPELFPVGVAVGVTKLIDSQESLNNIFNLDFLKEKAGFTMISPVGNRPKVRTVQTTARQIEDATYKQGRMTISRAGFENEYKRK